jgi:hypothetical protein
MTTQDLKWELTPMNICNSFAKELDVTDKDIMDTFGYIPKYHGGKYSNDINILNNKENVLYAVYSLYGVWRVATSGEGDYVDELEAAIKGDIKII